MRGVRSPRDRTGVDRRLVAPMVLGSVLNPINSSIIAVSLIPIGRAFDSSPSQTAWLVSALYLATAVGQPTAGRLVELLGARRLFLGATALVALGGLLGLVAQDLGTLVAARVLLGLGTSAGYPSSMHLIRSEARRTGHDDPAGILAVLAVANQTVAVLGPTLGGLLIGVAGWRSTFAVNIPLALACLWLGARRLPRPGPRVRGTRPHLDLLGTTLFGVLLVSGLLFLLEGRAELWPLVVLSAAASLAFVVVELRDSDPFIDLRLLAGNAPLLATYARALLGAAVTYVFLFGFTQWLQVGRGLGPEQAGLLIVPTFATSLLVTAVTGRRPQVRAKLVVGGFAQVGAAVCLLLVGDDTPAYLLVGVAVLVGVPQGLLNLANQNALYHQADPARTASAAGLLRTSTYIGALASAAAVGWALHDGATSDGLHRLGVATIAAAAAGLVVTLADRSLGRPGRAAPSERPLGTTGATRGPA